MTDIVKIETEIRSLDLSVLAEYDNKVQEIVHGSNPMTAPLYLRDFLVAYDTANTMLAKATRYLGKAKAALQTAESIAYFDNAPVFLTQKGVKDTVEARKQYVNMDPDVIKAMDVVAMAESMSSFLRNKLILYKSGHDDVKKMAYTQDSSPYES